MIFYITTHDENEHAARAMKELFKGSDIPYVFVYGKHSKNQIAPFIEVECEEKYENLPLKTYLTIEHFVNSGHDRFFKIDDDTFVDTEKVKSISFTEDYIGMFRTHPTTAKNSIYHWYKLKTDEFKVPKKHIPNLTYAEGASYSLSKKAAQIVYNKGREFYVNTPETYLGEDVKVGIALEKENITKRDIKSQERLPYEIAEDFLFIHPVHHTLFKKLKNTTNEEKQTLLLRYNILNVNIKREIYLTNKLSELKLI